MDWWTSLVATFEPAWANVLGHAFGCNGSPFDSEAAAVAKERSPDSVPHVDHDSEATRGFVMPFPNVGDSAEQHRKREPNRPLVKALRARTQPKPTLVINRQVDVDGQMFVRAEGVDNSAPSRQPLANVARRSR